MPEGFDFNDCYTKKSPDFALDSLFKDPEVVDTMMTNQNEIVYNSKNTLKINPKSNSTYIFELDLCTNLRASRAS